MGGVLLGHYVDYKHSKERFPSPLEAWVVSYETKPAETKPAETFPSPIEDWVVSYFRRIRIPQILSQVSGPYRGLGSILRTGSKDAR